MNELLNTAPENFDLDNNPSPNNPPWGSFAAISVFALSVALIVVLPNIFIIPYIVAKGIKTTEEQALVETLLSDPVAVAIMLGATFAAHIVTLIVAWLVITRIKKYRFTEMVGWKWGGFKLWHCALLLIAVYVFFLVMSGLLGNQENDMTRLLKSSRTAVYLVAFIATFSAPIIEEVIYRGVLYSAFQRTAGTPISKLIRLTFSKRQAERIINWIDKFSFLKSLRTKVELVQIKHSISIAVFAVTLLFAAVHVPQYYPNFAVIISILVVSLVITLIRVKTDNLLPCIIFHFAFNGIQMILLILEPYLPKSLTANEAEALFYWLIR